MTYSRSTSVFEFPFVNNSLLAYYEHQFFIILAIKGEKNDCIDEYENGEHIIHNVKKANICNKTTIAPVEPSN